MTKLENFDSTRAFDRSLMDRRDKMASGSSINSFKRKLDDLESSSLPSDAKEQLRMVRVEFIAWSLYSDSQVNIK